MATPLFSKTLSRISVAHAFGTRAQPVNEPFRIVWDPYHPRWKQVHGTDSTEVLHQGQACGEVDALYSFKHNVPIGVMTADCVPILLARKDGKGVAAVHAGWRGTKARILEKLWHALKARGEKPSDWVAAIGPAIGPCCYEVSEELASDFEREFTEAGAKLAVPSARHLDLPAINAWQLERMGIAEIDLMRACTRCSGPVDDPTFHSYRREGGGHRQFSIIVII
jgi:polyphenol oxidase